MSFTPYNALLLGGLLGDRELTPFFSVAAELDAYKAFETALIKSQTQLGLVPQEASAHILDVLATFDPDLKAISEHTAVDGVTVPEFVRQLKAAVRADYREFVHLGATSQDLIDSSLALRIKSINPIFESRLTEIKAELNRLSKKYGKRQMMGRTRMQKAIPILVSERISSWSRPLAAQTRQLSSLQSKIEIVQFGGPVGTLGAFGVQGKALRKLLAAELGLHDPKCCWHTDRSRVINYLTCLTEITTALGKIGQDMILMAQNEIAEIKLSGAGASSAMPHKQNPIKSEVLVTLARFSASQMGLMHQAALHEQERSGINWSLEWMIVPQLILATGAALRLCCESLLQIEQMGRKE